MTIATCKIGMNIGNHSAQASSSHVTKQFWKILSLFTKSSDLKTNVFAQYIKPSKNLSLHKLYSFRFYHIYSYPNSTQVIMSAQYKDT